MNERLVGNLIGGLIQMALWFAGVVCLLMACASIGNEPSRAIALGVVALFFQRAADGWGEASRRARAEEAEAVEAR